MSVLAVIPARGGSKSIPGKNITPVGRKPLLAWTIEAACGAAQVERVVLSTDSQEIAAVGRQYHAETPFLRPLALARDDTPGIAPIIHAVEWLFDHQGYHPEYVMCLQPTSPLRTSADIDAAITLASRLDADGVVSVTKPKHHPNWLKSITPDGRMVAFLNNQEIGIFRRQDLPPVYALNGAIYLVKFDVLMDLKTWYTEKTYAYEMPPERSLDIDTPWDLHMADLILRERQGNGHD